MDFNRLFKLAFFTSERPPLLIIPGSSHLRVPLTLQLNSLVSDLLNLGPKLSTDINNLEALETLNVCGTVLGLGRGCGQGQVETVHTLGVATGEQEVARVEVVYEVGLRAGRTGCQTPEKLSHL